MTNYTSPSDMSKSLLTRDSRVMVSSVTGKVFLTEGYKVIAHLEWAEGMDLRTVCQIILATVN